MSLKPPKPRVVNLWKIQDMLEDNIIKLDAVYQRDIVWHPSKMSMLIDSIMKKYYIPPLLFAVRTDDRGKKIRVCIDGKQRLTSILRFMKNEIPYLDESTGVTEEVYFGLTDGSVKPDSHKKDNIHHRYLSEEARDYFNDSELVMIEFSDLDEDQELEIFARVQMGVSITAAEKLVATNSDVSKFCRSLLEAHQHLDSSIRQLQDSPFKWIAQLTFILHQGDKRYVATHPKLMEFLKDKSITLGDGFKRKVKRTVKLLDTLFKSEAGKASITYRNNTGGERRRDSLRNIEFLIFGYYVSELNHNTRAPQMAADLDSLRQYLVEVYGRPLHTGNPCWSAGLAWKNTMMESRRRTAPAAAQASSSFTRRQSVVAESDSSSSDENDMDSDETNGHGARHLKKQQREPPIPASKRRRNSRKDHVETKYEGHHPETSTTTHGHVNEHGRPLARRGGKKSSAVGRKT